MLLNPAYSRYYLNLGEVSSYPPGYKENAGVFCHNNAWIIIAEAMLGRGREAMEYYAKICPAFREEIGDVHRLEPYVYAQMIAGKDAGRQGEAKNSWLTGTASRYRSGYSACGRNSTVYALTHAFHGNGTVLT